MYHLTVLVDGSLHAVHYAHYKIQCCKTWDNMSGSSTFKAPSLSVITYYFSKGTHLWILQKRDSVANKYIEHSTYIIWLQDLMFKWKLTTKLLNDGKAEAN